MGPSPTFLTAAASRFLDSLQRAGSGSRKPTSKSVPATPSVIALPLTSKIRVNPGIAARLKSFALNLGRANGIGNIQHGFWLNLQDVASVCVMKGV